VEEAQALSSDSLKKLTPTIRRAGSQLIFTMNPGSSEDPMSQRFLIPFQDALDRDGIYEDDLHLVIRINYSDNPWHTDTLEEERRFDEQHLSAAEYRHIWLGDYMDEVEGSIIPVEWFEAAIDAHRKLGFEPMGAKVVAHDPSDEGTDAKGLAVIHGPVVLDASELWGKNRSPVDVNAGMDIALARARTEGADHFVWDVDGLGAGLRRQATQQLANTRTEPHEFRGGGEVDLPDASVDPDAPGGRTNRDTYPNRRSQEYFRLADRFRRTWQAVVKGKYSDPERLISISSEIESIDKLRAEVCRIPRKPHNGGMHVVMSKPEMLRKHKIKSPNMADSLMMAFSALSSTTTAGWGTLPENDTSSIV
jgi:phage terminase large subunit